jgi:heme oxygenase
MRMPRVNVYLPEDLASEVSAAELNVSAIVQQALRDELAKQRASAWLDGVRALPPVDIPEDAIREALAGAKEDFGRLRA